MNIFLRELKAYRNSLIFWSIGMVALVASGMAKYAAYQSTGTSANDLIAQFPKAVQAIFGVSGFDLSRASGFYGVLFLYIALMGTIHAVLVGSDIISKEERDRTSEFLFVKPVSRSKALTAKLLAGLVNIVIFNIIALISSIYFVNYFGKESSTHDILILTEGLLFLQLIFFSIGALIAAGSKKPKTAPSAATSVLLVTFTLSFLVNLNDKLDSLKYFTPYKYFDAKTLLADGHLGIGYMILSGIIFAASIYFSYYSYSKRDLNV